MAHEVKNLPLSYETIRYAMDCIENGEKALALDVVAESDLAPEHKAFIYKAIEELGEKILKGRDLSRFENRLMSVLQPQTYAFLSRADLVGGVVSFLTYPAKAGVLPQNEINTLMDAALILGVEKEATDVKQGMLRHGLASSESLNTQQFQYYQKTLHHPETGQVLQLHELLALAHEFTELYFQNDMDFDAFAKALAQCPKTKFMAATQEYNYQRQVNNAYMRELIKLPGLQELDVNANDNASRDLGLFEKSKLRKLCISFDHQELTDSHARSLNDMPHLESLDLSNSSGLYDAGLLRISGITTLKELRIKNVYNITLPGLRALLKRAPQIKIVSTSFQKEEVQQLQKEFPNVVIKDVRNLSYKE